MGRGVMDLCWTCLETCLELPKSRYLVSLYSDLMDQFKGSMITSENNRVARESSRVIILKSRLNSTGYSACTSEVRDIFDRQTRIPNDWWQPMCSRVFQPWGRRNSTTAPVRNITKLLFRWIKRVLKQVCQTGSPLRATWITCFGMSVIHGSKLRTIQVFEIIYQNLSKTNTLYKTYNSSKLKIYMLLFNHFSSFVLSLYTSFCRLFSVLFLYCFKFDQR